MNQRVLVTGGTGFLGSAICRLLIKKGYQVSNFSRKVDPDLQSIGINCFQGDLSSFEDVKRSVADHDAVIHVAAKAGVWGDPKHYYQANVLGTEHVIKAAQESGITKLVYTSSASVAFDGRNIKGLGEDQCPYPNKFYTTYPRTKVAAEKMVLAANGKCDLATVSIRPHLIWGPGDPHFLPRLLDASVKNRLCKIGKQDNFVDVIHVENAAHAHLLALEQLSLAHKIAGKAYFIGQEKPVNLWWFIDQLLLALGKPAINKSISFPIAYSAGAAAEALFLLLRLKKEPPITRFVALQMSRSHFFSHNEAERDFGYKPIVSLEDGLKGLQSHLSR